MQPWVGVLLIGALIVLWLMITNINLLLSLQRTPAEPRTRSEFYLILFLGAQMSGMTKLVEYMKRGSRRFLLGLLATTVVHAALIGSVMLPLAFFDTKTSAVALIFYLLFAIELLIAAVAGMYYSNSRDRGTV